LETGSRLVAKINVRTTDQTSQNWSVASILTSSSAIAEGPHNALSQIKSCQLLHNCTGLSTATLCWMGTQPPPQSTSVVAKQLQCCMDEDATWYGGRPRPMRHCVRWGPGYPQKKGHTHPHPIFGPCLLWLNGWMDQDATWYGSTPRRKIHFTCKFAFSYIGSVTARHSSSGRQPNFATWYKKLNYYGLLWNRADHYIFILWFLLLSFLVLFFLA